MGENSTNWRISHVFFSCFHLYQDPLQHGEVLKGSTVLNSSSTRKSRLHLKVNHLFKHTDRMQNMKNSKTYDMQLVSHDGVAWIKKNGNIKLSIFLIFQYRRLWFTHVKHAKSRFSLGYVLGTLQQCVTCFNLGVESWSSKFVVTTELCRWSRRFLLLILCVWVCCFWRLHYSTVRLFGTTPHPKWHAISRLFESLLNHHFTLASWGVDPKNMLFLITFTFFVAENRSRLSVGVRSFRVLCSCSFPKRTLWMRRPGFFVGRGVMWRGDVCWYDRVTFCFGWIDVTWFV